MMNRKGFTLVELMVVIVIIGVLAAVAIPKFTAATNKAKASEFPTVLSQIVTAQEAALAESDAYKDCGAAATVAPGAGATNETHKKLKSELGVDIDHARYFTYGAESALAATPAYLASANLRTKLGEVSVGSLAAVNGYGVKGALVSMRNLQPAYFGPVTAGISLETVPTETTGAPTAAD